MIGFFLERFIKAVSIHRKWLLWAFVPVIIYLMISAAIPDRFVVRQKISITGDTLISLSPRPADLRSLEALISAPDHFFRNRFALSLLAKKLDKGMPSAQSGNLPINLSSEVEKCLTFEMTAKNSFNIVYVGSNREQGETMVAFYAGRLITQAGDYLAITPSAVKDGAVAPKMVGTMTVEEKRSPWRYKRLWPALYLFVSTWVVLLILIALLEWFKPSFRSVRHVAQYLRVPILGAVPNLKCIAGVMKS